MKAFHLAGAEQTLFFLAQITARLILVFCIFHASGGKHEVSAERESRAMRRTQKKKKKKKKKK